MNNFDRLEESPDLYKYALEAMKNFADHTMIMFNYFDSAQMLYFWKNVRLIQSWTPTIPKGVLDIYNDIRTIDNSIHFELSPEQNASMFYSPFYLGQTVDSEQKKGKRKDDIIEHPQDVQMGLSVIANEIFIFDICYGIETTCWQLFTLMQTSKATDSQNEQFKKYGNKNPLDTFNVYEFLEVDLDKNIVKFEDYIDSPHIEGMKEITYRMYIRDFGGNKKRAAPIQYDQNLINEIKEELEKL
jgi:hypothetical protein